MDLTKEALQLFTETAQKAANAQILSIPGDPFRLLVSQAGAREILELPASRRNHKLNDLDSLLALADRFQATSVLWHSEQAIVLVTDDEVRRDQATLELEFSMAYNALRIIGEGQSFDQKEFIRLLKVTLCDCVPPDLLPAVRTLKFSRNESGASEVNHGQASMGRQVEASITGASKIPESFVVQTNVYSNVLQDQTVQIRVAIDIDLEKHSFDLSIVGDDLSTSMLLTQEALAERLAEGNDQRRILFGKP